MPVDPSASAARFTRGVSTGAHQTFQLQPFRIVSVTLNEQWPIGDANLKVEYEIADPNHKIRSGRILYAVPVDTVEAPPFHTPGDRVPAEVSASNATGPLVVVHEHALSIGELTHGPHTVPQTLWWDGVATQGARRGHRLPPWETPVTVIVEVWSKEGDPPSTDEGDGFFPGIGSVAHLARGRDAIELSVVTEATWARSFCIPHGDLDDPQDGEVELEIRTRGIPDGTAAAVLVTRIGDADDSSVDDYAYTESNAPENGQQQLNDLVVRGDRVVQVNGNPPVVQFTAYDEHWAYPGNNFYSFRVSFGGRRQWVKAASRNPAEEEDQCCHMRFTVYIHPGDASPIRIASLQRIVNMLNNQTQYFRGYTRSAPPSDVQTAHRLFSHRYIACYLGHGWGDCWHPDHPRMEGTEFPVDHTHRGFVPNTFVCPSDLRANAETLMVQERQHYHRPIGAGCGHAEAYRSMLIAHRNYFLLHKVSEGDEEDIALGVPNRNALQPMVSEIPLTPTERPRFYFHAGACRSIVTTGFARAFHAGGTKYFHGWQYSVYSDYNRWFLEWLLTQWIKVTGRDQGEPEWDEARFLRVYNDYASREDYGAHDFPTLHSASGIMSTQTFNGAAVEAMR